MGKWNQGTYKVLNKEKYMAEGDPYYRSEWERRCMYYLDTNENVTKWGSENVVIPYLWIDGKSHRYYTDFYVELLNREGKVEKLVLEVKPKDQCPGGKIPKPPRKKTVKSMKNYQDRLLALKRNEMKWESAEKFCKKKGWAFKVITEDDIFRNY